MNDKKPANRLNLDQFATRVEELVALCERLQQENARLRAQNNRLLNERVALVEKGEVSRQRIESIVSRLKTMEVEL
jgi:cell division protein ZapB